MQISVVTAVVSVVRARQMPYKCLYYCYCEVYTVPKRLAMSEAVDTITSSKISRPGLVGMARVSRFPRVTDHCHMLPSL